MNYINIFWTKLSNVDFILYIIFPSVIFLLILTYILFNIRLIKLSFDYDLFLFSNMRSKMEDRLRKIINKN